MNITSYSFQSTYPNPVQIGTPNPQTEQQNEVNAGVENRPKVSEQPTVSETKTFLEQTKKVPSINVDSVAGTIPAADAVSKFTAVNTQLQASAAYSS